MAEDGKPVVADKLTERVYKSNTFLGHPDFEDLLMDSEWVLQPSGTWHWCFIAGGGEHAAGEPVVLRTVAKVDPANFLWVPDHGWRTGATHTIARHPASACVIEAWNTDFTWADVTGNFSLVKAHQSLG